MLNTVFRISLLPTAPQPLQPLEAPSNFRVSITTSTTITFNWDALDNEQTDGMLSSYIITCSERNNFSVSKGVLCAYVNYRIPIGIHAKTTKLKSNKMPATVYYVN